MAFRILIGLLLAVPPAGCAPKPAGDPPALAEPRAAPDRTVNWPQIDGFEREGPRRFDDPRLGYAMTYISAQGLAATVYLYDRGLPAVPDGASELARAELANAIGDIEEARRRGMYKTVSGADSKRSNLGSGPGAPEAWSAAFRLKPKEGDEAVSHLYVTGRRGEFVKIRCTYAAVDKLDCEPGLMKLLESLGAALKP